MSTEAWRAEHREELAERSRLWREENPDRKVAGDLAWRQDHPSYMRAYRLQRYYGLSLADYDAMLAAQGGGCFFCRRLPEQERYGMLSVDHCHETGRVRGLLCGSCNRALGVLGDTTEKVERIVAYLKGIL